MPGIMFQDVVCSARTSNRQWYTVPLSFLVHTFILAVLIVAPLIATDSLPRPRALMQFVTPFVPVVPSPPPARALRRARDIAGRRSCRGTRDDRPRVGRDLRTGQRRHRRHRRHRGTSDVGQIWSMRRLLPLRQPPPIVFGGNIKPPTEPGMSRRISRHRKVREG